MPKKDKSIKKVLKEIENKAIESSYTNMNEDGSEYLYSAKFTK